MVLFVENNLKQFITWADFARNAERHVLSLLCGLYRIEVVAYFVYVDIHHACSRTRDEQLVAHAELGSFACKLSNTKL